MSSSCQDKHILMNDYVVNDLKTDEFQIIITLLNCEAKISDILKLIYLPSLKNKKILIDTALVSGMNRYRFIEIKVNDNGCLNLSKYKYINVDVDILNKANSIIRNKPDQLNCSILTTSQKNI